MDKIFKIYEKMSCSGMDCDSQDFYVDGNVPYGSYDGLSIQQHFKVVKPFCDLINNVKPSQIIEIGTAAGGLTLMLRDILDIYDLNESSLFTYDLYTPNYLIDRINKDNINIVYYSNNLFSENYDDLVSTEEIKNLIQRQGRTIVLCDGGSKKNEFKLLSKLLKSGDIIMAHDYSPNQEYFDLNIKNKIWYWLEIQDTDIIPSINENNLIPYMEDEFKNVVWVCKEKK
jgi:cephalosporin hydroxylase